MTEKKESEKKKAKAPESLSVKRNKALAEKVKAVEKDMQDRADAMNKAQPKEVFNVDPFAKKHGHRSQK